MSDGKDSNLRYNLVIFPNLQEKKLKDHNDAESIGLNTFHLE